MPQAKKKKTVNQDPMLEGTGQPGELYGAPEGAASPGYLEGLEKAKQEAEMELQGIPQDPMLKGTGQPGELDMTPGTPEFDELMQKQQLHEVLSNETAKGFTLDQAMLYGFKLFRGPNKENNNG